MDAALVLVEVQEAASVRELPLSVFMQQCAAHLGEAGAGLLVDTPFLPRVVEGTFRVYMVGSQPMKVRVPPERERDRDRERETVHAGNAEIGGGARERERGEARKELRRRRTTYISPCQVGMRIAYQFRAVPVLDSKNHTDFHLDGFCPPMDIARWCTPSPRIRPCWPPTGRARRKLHPSSRRWVPTSLRS